MHETLFSSVWMGHVVDKFEVVDLVESVMRDGLLASHNPPAVWRREFWLITKLLPDWPIYEEIE
jgi:hypothetical protein